MQNFNNCCGQSLPTKNCISVQLISFETASALHTCHSSNCIIFVCVFILIYFIDSELKNTNFWNRLVQAVVYAIFKMSCLWYFCFQYDTLILWSSGISAVSGTYDSKFNNVSGKVKIFFREHPQKHNQSCYLEGSLVLCCR